MSAQATSAGELLNHSRNIRAKKHRDSAEPQDTMRTQKHRRDEKSNKPATCRLSCRDYVSRVRSCRSCVAWPLDDVCREGGMRNYADSIGATANAANFRCGDKKARTCLLHFVSRRVPCRRPPATPVANLDMDSPFVPPEVGDMDSPLKPLPAIGGTDV